MLHPEISKLRSKSRSSVLTGGCSLILVEAIAAARTISVWHGSDIPVNPMAVAAATLQDQVKLLCWQNAFPRSSWRDIRGIVKLRHAYERIAGRRQLMICRRKTAVKASGRWEIRYKEQRGHLELHHISVAGFATNHLVNALIVL